MLIEVVQNPPIPGSYEVSAAVVVDGVAVATVTLTGANVIPAEGPWNPGVASLETVRLVDGLPVVTVEGPAAAFPGSLPYRKCEEIALGIVTVNAANSPEVARWNRYGGRAGGLEVATAPVPFGVYRVEAGGLVRFDPFSDPSDGTGRILSSEYAAGLATGYGDPLGSLYNTGGYLWADEAGNLPVIP